MHKVSNGQQSLFDDAPPGSAPPKRRQFVSPRQRELLDMATAIEMEDGREAGTIGYAARLWAQLSLPYREPNPDTRLWVRRNGSLTLRVIPGMTGPKGLEVPKYPFGVLPRYILTWMSTEAVRTRSPELQLGNSLSDFMSQLGLSATGGKNGSIARLTDQMRRLLSSSMSVEDTRSEDNRWGIAGGHFAVAAKYQLWFDAKDTAGEHAMWGSKITLSDAFYESIIAAPVPIDTRALSALAGSALKIDLLVWLCHRLGYLRSTQLVPWELLAAQFGSDYARLRDFKSALTNQLREVLAVYPGANVDVINGGILLRPSRTAIPRRPKMAVTPTTAPAATLGAEAGNARDASQRPRAARPRSGARDANPRVGRPSGSVQVDLERRADHA